MPMALSTLSPALLKPLLEGKEPPLLLDVRRRGSFTELPEGLPGAIPVYLDDDPILLPDLSRSQPIVAYCL